MKHVTIRFAWHDNKWNGRICKDPKSNIYCIDNYSLLSPRIQKRIDLEVEDSFKECLISDSLNTKNYFPPCYWVINAFGDNNYVINDPHPFQDTTQYGERFKSVPPLRNNLKDHSVYTWCFKLGFNENQEVQLYVPIEELERRVDFYTREILANRSIAFFYANYSNPLTGDDYKYALLGAGLVRDIEKPLEYNIPSDLLKEIQSQKRMRNFHTMAWQFQVSLDPNLTFIMPYHEYLEWVNKAEAREKENRLKKLNEIVIPIEGNLIPHFKYVSMHLNHDKAIFLLYLLKKSLRKIREHGELVVSYSDIKSIEDKINKLLEIAWKERGQYPGFENALYCLLKNDFESENLYKIIQEVKSHIINKYGSLDKFFKERIGLIPGKPIISKALNIIEENKELLEFLSRFDFSIKQFRNIKDIISKHGLKTVKNNPYLLLEKYYYDEADSWNIDEADYGIDIYQIDIALIPDLEYADWPSSYSSYAPERLRAVITKILYDAAKDGNTCLAREEIEDAIKDYPLYYITNELDVDREKLLNYEKQSLFKEKFIIEESIQNESGIYQLRYFRDIEDSLKQFIDKAVKKKYELSSNDAEKIETIISKEKNSLGNRLNVNERRRLYQRVLKNGLFVISGKAGSGKTSAVIELIKKFREDGHTPIYVFTPTGKASLVIKDRLKSMGLHTDPIIKVSTIHRFLYSAIFDAIKNFQFKYGFGRHKPTVNKQASKIVDLISKILSYKLEVIDQFIEFSKNFRFKPKVVIIDEASMVDEVLLYTLFAMINPDTLEHLVLVGDEKQLPPIGAGRPFVDTIFYLKQKSLEDNYIRLESNLRFDRSTEIGYLTELFSDDEAPSPDEVKSILDHKDKTFELHYFSNSDDIKNLIKMVLRTIRSTKDGPLQDMFGDIFEDNNRPILDKIQIITPRRVGNFGSISLNHIIMEKSVNFSPRTKLICEENKYVYLKKGRTLALANGSVGYIMPNGEVFFEELDDFEKEFGQSYEIKKLIKSIKEEVSHTSIKIERDINFGYAITVHKSQGSDYDYVILVINEISSFITRELLYTAFTRAKTKLYLFVHTSLKEELHILMAELYNNSSIEYRRTLLFGYKTSTYKPYILRLKNGSEIAVRSKIEYMIAKTLDDMGIEFEYEPKDFQEHNIIPDFKLYINEDVYYLEHLGNMNNRRYRNRWNEKIEIYKRLGVIDMLVTTSEKNVASNVENGIRQMINDIMIKQLKDTLYSYSKHHYEL